MQHTDCRYFLHSLFFIVLCGLLLSGCQSYNQQAKMQSVIVEDKLVNAPQLVALTKPKSELTVEVKTVENKPVPYHARLQVLLTEIPEIGLIGKEIAEQSSVLNEQGHYSLVLLYDPALLDMNKAYHLKLQIIAEDKVLFTQFNDIEPTEVMAAKPVNLLFDLNAKLVGNKGLHNIDNTRWELMSLGKAIVEPFELNGKLHLQLRRKENKVIGFSGCNRFSGQYLLQRSKINFLQLKSTRKMCLENMRLEHKFLAMLNNAERFVVEPEKLILMNKKGTALAYFSPSLEMQGY